LALALHARAAASNSPSPSPKKPKKPSKPVALKPIATTTTSAVVKIKQVVGVKFSLACKANTVKVAKKSDSKKKVDSFTVIGLRPNTKYT
jgi:hypothetical protein